MEGHVYQVCARKGDDYFDGLVFRELKVLKHEQYMEVKTGLGEKMGVDPKSLTIISLNYLGETQCQ